MTEIIVGLVYAIIYIVPLIFLIIYLIKIIKYKYNNNERTLRNCIKLFVMLLITFIVLFIIIYILILFVFRDFEMPYFVYIIGSILVVPYVVGVGGLLFGLGAIGHGGVSPATTLRKMFGLIEKDEKAQRDK
jgi:hypothetical protein